MAFPLLITVCSREQVIPILARYASSKHCKWLQVKLLASSVDQGNTRKWNFLWLVPILQVYKIVKMQLNQKIGF